MKILFKDPLFGDITLYDIINYLEYEIEREKERREELKSILQEWNIDKATINYINELYHTSYYLYFLRYCFENMEEEY